MPLFIDIITWLCILIGIINAAYTLKYDVKVKTVEKNGKETETLTEPGKFYWKNLYWLFVISALVGQGLNKYSSYKSNTLIKHVDTALAQINLHFDLDSSKIIAGHKFSMMTFLGKVNGLTLSNVKMEYVINNPGYSDHKHPKMFPDNVLKVITKDVEQYAKQQNLKSIRVMAVDSTQQWEVWQQLRDHFHDFNVKDKEQDPRFAESVK